MRTIAVFDFLSHATMHLPFNAGYIKVLLAAFPQDEVMLFAATGHIENLKREFPEETRISWHAQKSLGHDGKDLNSPVWGSLAAKRCFQDVTHKLKGKALRLGAMSGADANLLRIFRSKWPSFTSEPLHYILHNHLAASFHWRSKNPYYRWFDFVSEFNRGLPQQQQWVTLEKGIKDSVVDFAPKLANNIVSLPHPITYDAGIIAPEKSIKNRPLKVAFLGHCGPGKGFDFFVSLANKFAGPNMEFWAIGRENAQLSNLNVSKLVHRPTKGYLEPEDYYKALAEIDLVVLPLADHYRYVASGSVLDAISYLKPIVTVENPTYRRIADEYGSFGPMVESRDAIVRLFETHTKEELMSPSREWREALSNIREQRAPEWLAADYKKTVLPIN